ncbi:hypothetical protein EJ08DRAFT_130338 [Tothia fuscella]|uniref:Uncharacterized protein n=1 Tax=Tothia fuscella TaxID=1048955 RepID=A0A9P4U0D5_9PEZI|nr:hypothetical protein EJ08DRAFT_130338 [Tothia fuscella]
MLTRRWIKFVLALLIGFWIGILMGFISSTLLFALLPAQWVENGFRDRASRIDDFIMRRKCGRRGFRENFDPVRNSVCEVAIAQQLGCDGIACYSSPDIYGLENSDPARPNRYTQEDID